ncbi:winged helix-turn-helix transcriptional regulator [Actinokineospora fastidiosa]|uniref:Transcriptional regulator n=1 Tax=Actinokineospora fastidiosa TaxID=1816 RepID=A0A918GF31_9PSEU|nr:helix-turn-helix domain-containing protein [Actinokineospora fastidiosa]GGS32249.1 transcriptional regulator [Actinokineospora fastidiosa]
MKRYEQHCPVARAAEVVTQPWTLLIVRELLHGPADVDTVARGLPGLTVSTLISRLRSLRSAGLVAREAGRFRLTEAGRDLRAVVDLLGAWSGRWLPAPGPKDLDPGLLMYDIARNVDAGTLPPRPVALLVEFTDGPPPRRWWLTLNGTGASAGDRDPGLPIAVTIRCSLATLAAIWLGHRKWLDALADESLQLIGDRSAVRSAVSWIGVSRYSANA